METDQDSLYETGSIFRSKVDNRQEVVDETGDNETAYDTADSQTAIISR